MDTRRKVTLPDGWRLSRRRELIETTKDADVDRTFIGGDSYTTLRHADGREVVLEVVPR